MLCEHGICCAFMSLYLSVKGGGGRSGTVGGRLPQCFFWEPDQHRKDIIQQQLLGTDML